VAPAPTTCPPVTGSNRRVTRTDEHVAVAVGDHTARVGTHLRERGVSADGVLVTHLVAVRRLLEAHEQRQGVLDPRTRLGEDGERFARGDAVLRDPLASVVDDGDPVFRTPVPDTWCRTPA